MTGTKTKKSTTPEAVFVVVVVNHDDLRRGEVGEVELTDTVRGRLDKGYLRLAEPEETELNGSLAAPLGATADRGQPAGGVLLGVDQGSATVVPGVGVVGDDPSGAVHTAAG